MPAPAPIATMLTIDELLRRRAGDDGLALVLEDSSWTWDELLGAAAERADLLASLRRDGPFHVGVLLDNVPEFVMWLSAAAVSGAVVVGINPTRRGSELARDITHTECQLIVTDENYRPLLGGLGLGLSSDRILDVGSDLYAEELEARRGADLPPGGQVEESSMYLLLFTSGTSGAPKACICSQGRLARIGDIVATNFGLSGRDVCYQAMPLFHSNALMAGWAPALAGGSTTALRARFSASAFLTDVRRYGATFFNYVGKPLSYILATPEHPDDADNPLTRVFGNEAADHDIERFAARFGCRVIDGYGSTEGGVSVTRTEAMPQGALGRGTEGTVVLDPATGEECPPARFDEAGILVNPDEAIGELANRLGRGGFEGYWKNDEAERARLRDGIYWTGDLAYRDTEGYLYFAGRDVDRLRVDGENFAAAPVERVLDRHPDVVLVAVYAVPDPDVGDQVMAALQLRPGTEFDPESFSSFLSEQEDMGTKWAPRFVRVATALPATETNKILKRELRRERWECSDPVWWQPSKGESYRRLSESDVETLREQFANRGRLSVLAAT